MPEMEKVKILIVDDLQEKILVLQSVLTELGEEVVVARSGSEALAQVLKNDFAVILLDINMPDMDGYETAALIRKRRRSAHVPIIFITSFHDQVHEAQGYSLGAVDYILSPVVPDILRTKVKVFADLFRMTAEVKRAAEERVALVREQAAREAAERHAAALRESEERFRLASEAVTGFIYEVDVASGRGNASPGFTELLGYHHDESRTLEWWAGRLHPDDLPGAIQLITDAERGGKKHYRFEYRILHKNGHYLHVWDQGVIVRDPDGRPVRRVGNVVDITERKRAEEALAEANRRKDEFLSMLAHELRNPLAPIRNAAQILRLKDVGDPQIRTARDIIDRNVTQMTRLVDDLLDVSRITQGKIRLDCRPINLASVVTQAIEICTPLLETRKQKLSVSLPREPVTVNGDDTRLTQVVANLLTNAAKYSDNGSSVWLSVVQHETNYVIQVRDNGIGLAPDVLESVFDPFIQIETTLHRSQGGLGIGLTLVRRLVEMHRGTVTAFSEGLGCGSTFTVTLPRHAQTDRSVEANGKSGPIPVPLSTSPKRVRRVLVVDDNVDAAESLGFLIRVDGHEVQLAHSGPEALKVAIGFNPDLVFLDIGLPGLDGYEVARTLRNAPGTATSILVALTGYGQEEDRRMSQNAGFDLHLVKPVDPDRLRHVIVNHLKDSKSTVPTGA